MFELHQKRIKVIFTDFDMPVMSGPEMVERIRQKNKTVKIVGMTGLVEGDKDATKQLFMDFIIKKPPKM